MADDNALVAKPKQWWLATRDFYRDTSSEMKKVTWPTRPEIISTTIVVIVATLVFAVYLWGCDVLFFKGVDLLFKKFGGAS